MHTPNQLGKVNIFLLNACLPPGGPEELQSFNVSITYELHTGEVVCSFVNRLITDHNNKVAALVSLGI